MLVLRCTKKLLARIGRATIGTEGVSSTTRMGDWTANLFFIGRQQIVLGVNKKTLFDQVVPDPARPALGLVKG